MVTLPLILTPSEIEPNRSQFHSATLPLAPDQFHSDVPTCSNNTFVSNERHHVCAMTFSYLFGTINAAGIYLTKSAARGDFYFHPDDTIKHSVSPDLMWV